MRATVIQMYCETKFLLLLNVPGTIDRKYICSYIISLSAADDRYAVYIGDKNWKYY